MPEPKARKLAIAVLAVLVVIIVIPAVALFVRGGGDQPVQIILPTPGYWTTQWRRLGAARAAPLSLFQPCLLGRSVTIIRIRRPGIGVFSYL